MLGIFLISFASASLGTFQKGDCVNIKVLSNCSLVYLSIIENNNETFIIDSPMENIAGQVWNYTFCNTTNVGNYNYIWDENCVDCSGGLCGNNFEITNAGRSPPTTGEALNFLGIFGSIFFVAILFFAFSFLVKGALKFGFIATSFVLSLIIVLYSNVILSETINGFPRIAASYDIFFYIMLSLLFIIFLFVMISLFFQALDEWRTKHGKNPNKDPD